MTSQGVFRDTTGYVYSSAIHQHLLINIFQIKPIPVGFSICMTNVKLPEDLPFAVKRRGGRPHGYPAKIAADNCD
ncbi:hypothetical protein EDWATA_02245 [Edwardsiella tarda ATCC 23685]|uniref:Uncharacterized protein n=1 Tax=Edwardsiella tarda ATCC 23685 TaxID=500638 RepID=D4F664_EDWTA|nr:hypothetical protein EDWATA_02245 [Edwardsiella tarda ATCC 23685]